MYKCKVPKTLSRPAFQRRVALVIQENMSVNYSFASTSSNIPGNTQSSSSNLNNISNDSNWPWSDSESDAEIERDDHPIHTWIDDIREWALRNRVNHQTINDLLRILLSHNIRNIPRDARTLLKTPKTHEIYEISGGQYWHNGIGKNVSLIYSGNRNKPQEIELLFNIDGLPISKSSQSQFWPILGQIHNADYDPFFIGIFHGYSKPKDVDEYLQRFVTELNELLENGIVIDGAHINIICRCFLCDAPAKSLIKRIAYHNAYFGCNFCCVEGIYDDNRMSYSEFDCSLRTNVSFRNRNEEEHHKGNSILEELPIDMVRDFPNDYLHLILLGITKTLLKTWMFENNFATKLSAAQIKLANDILMNLLRSQPYEFARRIRMLDCLRFWKGTELRTWLLYTGPVVLKNILSPEAYNHFLALHCAVRICTSSLVDSHLAIAERLFKFFAEEYIEIYGEQRISYNVHNVTHVAEDVKRFGKLDSFSCFPSESKLYVLKNLLRKGAKPLAQAINRLAEMELLNPKQKEVRQNMLAKEHKEERGIYEEVFYNNMRFNTSEGNKWFLTKNNDIVEFKHAKYLKGNIVVVGSKIKRKFDFYETPLKSSLLNIYASNGLTDIPQNYHIESIKTKMFSMRYDDWGIMYSIYETVDDIGRRNVFGAPDNWLINGILYWPPKSKKINLLRKSRKAPEPDWECIRSFKILARNLPTFKDCLSKEKLLELHSDSESVEEAKKKKALKRRHPINSNSKLLNLYELNSSFETITAKSKNSSLKSNVIVRSQTAPTNKKQKVSSTVTSQNYVLEPEIDGTSYPGVGSKQSIIHSVEIIKAAPSGHSIQSSQFNEDNISFAQNNDLTLEYNVDLGGLDIENMELLLDESTGNFGSNKTNEIVSSKQDLQAQFNCETTDAKTLLRILSLEKKVDNIEAKQDRMEAKQDRMEAKQDTILKLLAASHVKLDLLANKTNPATKNIEVCKDVEIPVPLPVETDEDVIRLEYITKNNLDVADTLENMLNAIGGKDSRKCLYEIMKKLFSDDVLMNYTWIGTVDKKTFKDFKFLDLMKKCVRVHFPEYTDSKFKADVQEYLKHASTRVERRYL